MKQQDIKLGVEYAVIPSWETSTADKKNLEYVSRRDVVKATLVNLDKYEYKVFRSKNAEDSQFKPVPPNSRVVGFLVESDHWNDNHGEPTEKWISRPQDIVAPYADLEARWSEKERLEREEAERKRKEQEEQERKQREAYEYVNRVSTNLIESLRAVIGAKVENIKTDISNRRSISGDYNYVATMQLDMKTMELLVEKVLEAKDILES